MVATAARLAGFVACAIAAVLAVSGGSATIVGGLAVLGSVAALASFLGVTAPTEDDFAAVARLATDPMLVLDRHRRVRFVSPGWTTVFGHRPGDADGADVLEFVAPADRDAVHEVLRGVEAMADGRGADAEFQVLRRDGSTAHGRCRAVRITPSRGAVGVVLTVRDVTEERRAIELLRHQAFHDPLTGLANRALFHDRLRRAMQVRRSGPGAGPIVAFMDLDGFKEINDTHGHGSGDRVIAVVGERLARTIRGADTAARMGGDEFAVLFEDDIDLAGATAAVSRIIANTEAPIRLGNAVVSVRASVGIAAVEPTDADTTDVLSRADLAMYRAKSGGGGRFEVARVATPDGE